MFDDHESIVLRLLLIYNGIVNKISELQKYSWTVATVSW